MVDITTIQVIISAVSAIAMPIALYIGVTRGTGKTVDIALEKIEKRMNSSPTVLRILKLLEMSEKVFSDDQAVYQVTRFFKEAAELVSSPEVKNFFVNATKLMKEFSSEKKVELKMPKKEVK